MRKTPGISLDMQTSNPTFCWRVTAWSLAAMAAAFALVYLLGGFDTAVTIAG